METVTAETITAKQIRELDTLLPPDHYARHWVTDALVSSASHPHRQRNARRECASFYNTILPFQVWDEDGYVTSLRSLDEARSHADREQVQSGGDVIVYHSMRGTGRPDAKTAVYHARCAAAWNARQAKAGEDAARKLAGAAPDHCTTCKGPIDEDDGCRCPDECATCLGARRIRDGETGQLRRCLDCGGSGVAAWNARKEGR